MNLVDYLPLRLKGSQIGSFQTELSPIVEELRGTQVDFICQLAPSTATWGLEFWERALGLAVAVEKPLAYRRERIISKLRGAGTTTVAVLKSVAESFANGQVAVTEIPAEYRVEIEFVSQIGIPSNMDDLIVAMAEIIPAHLAYTFIYRYRTWGTLPPQSWGALVGFSWEEVKASENLLAME